MIKIGRQFYYDGELQSYDGEESNVLPILDSGAIVSQSTNFLDDDSIDVSTQMIFGKDLPKLIEGMLEENYLDFSSVDGFDGHEFKYLITIGSYLGSYTKYEIIVYEL